MMDFITTHGGLIGLLFFFTFFVLMAVWVYRPGSMDKYQNYAGIPLKESDYD